jgi:hypothetical protein
MHQRLGQHRLRLIGIVGLLALNVTLAGCSKSAGDGEKLVAVAGKVTVSGNPLTSGAVTFHPDTAKGNNTQHIPVGTLDAEGNYKLASATKSGAPLGWYKVTVTAQQPIDEKNPYAPPKHLINPKFGDVRTSGLAVQVVESAAPGVYDLKVTK